MISSNRAPSALQVTVLYELMMDPCPAVREAAVTGAATVLDRFWEVIPTVTAARYVARMVDDLAFDKASGAVRAAAVDGLALLVENALAQPLLKAVLPRVAPLLADVSPRVRGSVADLLLAVRGVRAIRFYEVVPVETLLKALGALYGKSVVSQSELPAGDATCLVGFTSQHANRMNAH